MRGGEQESLIDYIALNDGVKTDVLDAKVVWEMFEGSDHWLDGGWVVRVLEWCLHDAEFKPPLSVNLYFIVKLPKMTYMSPFYSWSTYVHEPIGVT